MLSNVIILSKGSAKMQTEDKVNNCGMEIGLYTLGDLVPDPYNGKSISSEQRLKEIIEAAKLADEAGLDLFGVGEHHRLDFAVSSPPVVLAAIAQVTKRIKLLSTTTVLSTIDPVRLFEDFATLDLLSNGRAEIMAGRGAFLESFPLFGFNIDDYDELFSENMNLLLTLNKNERVTWKGKFRSSLNNAEIAPRPKQDKLPIWIGVGGSPESAERAGRLGVGMVMAILNGDPLRFKPLVDLYRKVGTESGHLLEHLRLGVTGHGYIAETTQQAKEQFYPYYSNYWSYINGKLGMTGTMSKEKFEQMTSQNGALFVGSPEQIAEKILWQYEQFGHKRFIAQIDIGGVPFNKIAKGIELLATKVAPTVRKAAKN